MTMLENLEEVLLELNRFEKSSTNGKDEPTGASEGESSDLAAANAAAAVKIPPLLEEYISFVAKTGNTCFPWPKIKPLIKLKLEQVIAEFYSTSPTEDLPSVPNVDPFSFTACRDKVFAQLEFFNGIPFTVQRLCELLVAPKKHYKRTDKFMRALEKNVLVVSTVEAKANSSKDEDEEQEMTNGDGDNVSRPSSGHFCLNGDVDRLGEMREDEDNPKLPEEDQKEKEGLERLSSDGATEEAEEEDTKGNSPVIMNCDDKN